MANAEVLDSPGKYYLEVMKPGYDEWRYSLDERNNR